MVKYFSYTLGQSATIVTVDHKNEVVVYETDDGKQHIEKYEVFIKTFNSVLAQPLIRY